MRELDKSNPDHSDRKRPSSPQKDSELLLNREDFISLKATVGHVISDFRAGSFVSTSPPEDRGLLKPGLNVRVVFLDELNSFAFVPSRFDRALAEFFGSIPNRHFFKSDGVRYRRNKYAYYYQGVWVVPADRFRQTVEGLKRFPTTIEFVLPKRATRAVPVPDLEEFQRTFFDARTGEPTVPSGPRKKVL